MSEGDTCCHMLIFLCHGANFRRLDRVVEEKLGEPPLVPTPEQGL